MAKVTRIISKHKHSFLDADKLHTNFSYKHIPGILLNAGKRISRHIGNCCAPILAPREKINFLFNIGRSAQLCNKLRANNIIGAPEISLGIHSQGTKISPIL